MEDQIAGDQEKEERSITGSRQGYWFYPGWTMLGIAAAAQFMSAPGQSYSVATFKEPMRLALNISETQFSLAYAVATIVSGLAVPIIGRIVDRYGARKTLPVVALFLGLGCWSMTYATSLSGVYIGFTLIRPLGQGALVLIATWLVGEWYERRRGFATSIAALGGTASVMCVPLLNDYIIRNFGWEAGWGFHAIAAWTMLVIPGMLLIRDRPEALGLVPDGFQYGPRIDRKTQQCFQESNETSDTKQQGLAGWELSDVLRDRSFWMLLSVPATSGMVGTGLIFHQVSLLGNRGLSPSFAIGLLAFQAAVASCAALFAGHMTDRVPQRYMLCGAMGLLFTAVILVTVLPFWWLAILYSALIGLHGSVMRSTATVVWMTYYGRRNQGAVRGVAMAAMILAAAAGPLPLAIAIDQWGGYEIALYSFAVLSIIAAIAVWSAAPPIPDNRE